ncbi:MAG: peroxide stress protein YaaA [Thermoleophilia bacterium]|nr:peroxide stress protein YaaA [Thermoleophilia bacterium]
MAPRRPPVIVLPPSETKWAPTRGKPIDLTSLSFPGLTEPRAALLDADLRGAPATTVGRLYTGVLYAALDIPTLSPAAARNLVVVSAQFGALRTTDRVPAYRREMDARHWRDWLRLSLDEATAGRIIVDCRSATYVAAWRPSSDLVAAWVRVAVVEERNGIRRVVSHMAKKTRGEVARHLLVSGARPRTPTELADAVADGFACELAPPERDGAPFVLTVVKR